MLAKYGVEMIGANRDAIAGPRTARSSARSMQRIGLEVATPSQTRHSLDEAREALEEIGLPAIIRPAFTLGGTGGGIAYNRRGVRGDRAARPRPSMITEVLIDQSVLGWKEYELEVMRDRKDNASSSAASRTSTRWACTRATRSPSRRRRR
jgi:carbamoyl-phosphate synthase large subunit